jgi:hypothetical protein
MTNQHDPRCDRFRHSDGNCSCGALSSVERSDSSVNTARLVRVTASVPEICLHNVKLGQGCFCPKCPTASFEPAVEPNKAVQAGAKDGQVGSSVEPAAGQRRCSYCGDIYDINGPIHPCGMGGGFAT